MSHRRLRHLPFSLGSGENGAKLVLHAPALRGYADGDPVGTWNDLSGESNNATASGSARPIYKAATANGLPSVYFSGTAIMNIASTLPTGDLTTIATQWKDSGSGTLIASLSNDSQSYAAVFWSDGVIYAEGPGIPGGGFGSGAITTPAVVSTVSQTIDSVFINGAQRMRTASGTTGTTGFSKLGRTYSSSPSGSLASVIMYASAVSNALRQRIQQSSGFTFRIATK